MRPRNHDEEPDMASLHRDNAPSPRPPAPTTSRAHAPLGLGILLAAAGIVAALTIAVTGASATTDTADDYAIEVEAVTVKVGADGAALVRVNALPPYHWNKEYPARVTIEDGDHPSVTVDKREFKQLSGDFEIADDESWASVRIPVTGKAPGIDTLALDVRFSVCNDKVCLIKRASARVAVTTEP